MTIVGGRYELVRRLGQPGAQGDVYEAKDHHEGDRVAIKLLNVAGIPPGGTWVEAAILRRLVDNHILPIRNADLDQGQPYVVTELAQHGSLDGRLGAVGTPGLDIDEAVRLVRQACMGVARGHDLRLLHNDIKPANLFLNAQGECLVGDFGLASLLPPGATTTRAAGLTPDTAAPEVAEVPYLDGASVRSDVYSLGATAYWLIAGEPPYDFTGINDPWQQLDHVASTVPRRLWDIAPHVPPSVHSAIERAMARDPQDRFPRAVDFAEALGARRPRGRKWSRTDEHAGHERCWRGVPSDAGSTYLLCVTPGATASRCQITSSHVASGNKINKGCTDVPRRTMPQTIRSIMRRLS